MIIVSIAAHDHPQSILDLYSNVIKCYGDDVAVVVHLSADTREQFIKHAASRNLNLFRERLHWNNMPLHTRQGTVLPMHVSNFIYAKTIADIKFSHFQILSPSNLVIQEGVSKYVMSHDVLLKTVVPIKNWMWEEAVNQDERFTYFRERFHLGQPVVCRADGISCSVSIFSAFVRDLLHAYSLRDMEKFEPIYPLDETVLPTYLEKFRGFGIKFGDTRARAFEPYEPTVTIDKIQELCDAGTFYVKRISPLSEDPVRKFILSKFSLGPDVL